MNRKSIIALLGVIIFGALTFFMGYILGGWHGWSEGWGICQESHAEDIVELNKTLIDIQNYYSQYSAYPDSLEPYSSTLVYEEIGNGVRLSGNGGACYYDVKFLENGYVSIERVR